MQQQTLQTADYLDIIFYKRNKIYGGYELRRHYNRRMGKAFAGLMLGMSALVLLSFVSAGKKVAIDRPFTQPTVISEVSITPPPVVIPPKPTVAPPPAATNIKTHTLTQPVITDEVIPDDKRMSSVKDLKNSAIGMRNIDGDSTDIDIIPSNTNGKTKNVIPIETVAQAPRHVVEQMPAFTGDMNAYIASHIHYPDAAREAGIEGRVVIEFVVNEDGAISNARIVRSIGGGCDQEALKMVAGMPAWKPGKQNGLPVKVYFTIPIKFELN